MSLNCSKFSLKTWKLRKIRNLALKRNMKSLHNQDSLSWQAACKQQLEQSTISCRMAVSKLCLQAAFKVLSVRSTTSTRLIASTHWGSVRVSFMIETDKEIIRCQTTHHQPTDIKKKQKEWCTIWRWALVNDCTRKVLPSMLVSTSLIHCRGICAETKILLFEQTSLLQRWINL